MLIGILYTMREFLHFKTYKIVLVHRMFELILNHIIKTY